MRRLLEDAQMRPRIMAQELGGVPAGGGIVQQAPMFDPGASVQQQMPQQKSSGLGDLAGIAGDIMAQKKAQDKYDYAPVNVDWNAQSDKNALRMNDMYAQELTNPTGIIPAGSSSPSMVGLPQSGGSGLWGNLKGFFGGTR